MMTEDTLSTTPAGTGDQDQVLQAAPASPCLLPPLSPATAEVFDISYLESVDFNISRITSAVILRD